jgi:hypothetical protein
MEFPNDSDFGKLNRMQIINLLLASIGFEELALADLVKSEAELLRMALGKQSGGGNGQNGPLVNSLDDLLKINQSVNRTLKTITKKEKVLLSKLKEVVGLIEVQALENCSVIVETGGAVIDVAFLNENTIDFDVTVDNIDISINENCAVKENRIHMSFSNETGQLAKISLLEETATILCNSELNTALIRATVDLETTIDGLEGEYKALISVNGNGNMTVFLENELNRILFRISGADAEVDKCLNECTEPTNICECSVNISTNQNTVITIDPENYFAPGRVQDVYINVPCNCNASNSYYTIFIKYVIGGVAIEGEFIEGTISTWCDENGATITGRAYFGNTVANVFIQANRNGTVQATFEGESPLTIFLIGANVVIGECDNPL